MRINKITITNFMGFENKTFEFDESLSVIVGNNTAGKTTVLKALQIALGAYLKSLKSLPNDNAYSCNFSQSDVFRRYSSVNKDFFTNDSRTRIDVQASTYNVTDGWTDIQWWREYRGNKTTHTRECAGQIIDFANEIEARRATESKDINSVFPIVLSFGANRIDNQYRAAKKNRAKGF